MMYSADEKKKEIKILQSNYTDKAVRLDSSHWGKKKMQIRCNYRPEFNRRNHKHQDIRKMHPALLS